MAAGLEPRPSGTGGGPSRTLATPLPQGLWEAQGSLERVRASWECHWRGPRAAGPGAGSSGPSLGKVQGLGLGRDEGTAPLGPQADLS